MKCLGVLAIIALAFVCLHAVDSTSCQTANWRKSFDRKGLSSCPSGAFPYITGFYRNQAPRPSRDYIYHLEEARCCQSSNEFRTQPKVCVNADWLKSFNRYYTWNKCPKGYFLNGLYRSYGNYLSHIDYASCCKPQSHPFRYNTCYNENVSLKFNYYVKGLVSCSKPGHYITGLYRSGCNYLYCIDAFSCCSMAQMAGLKFSSKTYIFLTTMGANKDVIGKVQVETTTSDVVYSSLTTTSLLNIDKNTGALKLLIHLDQAAVKFNNTRLVIQAQSKSQNVTTTTTTVIIIILKDFHGDLFAREMINRVNSVMTSNHILRYGTSKITAAALHRFLRKISETAKPISMAQVKFEKVIQMIKGAIMEHFEAQFGDEAVVSACLHIKRLLSPKMINQIESKMRCMNTTVVDPKTCPLRSEYRTINGICNNLLKPNRGASNIAFIRLLPAKYFDADGLNDPIGYPDQPNAPTVPSPFEISRDFIKDEVASSSSPTLTHAVMQFGQFLDHDIDLATDSEESDHCRNVSCTGSRPDFECPCYPILPLPEGGTTCDRVIRSAAVCQENKGYPTTREQINVNTAFVDASQIYGSTEKRAKLLRQDKSDDQGLLRSSSNGFNGELLPLDTTLAGGADQLCQDVGGCFIAGDARSNEQQALASFQSLFLREHNRIARKLKSINSHWNGERVYQETRKILGAVFQKITYHDYLPLILGPNSLPPYTGYKRDTDPGISNAFATAAFRFGHSTIRPEFDLLNENFDPIAPAINLRFMFFNNTFIRKRGIEPLLFGLVGNLSENVDRTLSPGIVKHLFERKNSPGQNLAALNIQRSRDHGLPGYNKFRGFCGMSNAGTFEDTKNEINYSNRQILKQLYNDDPNLAELWVAGLAEAPVPGAQVGPTFKCIIADQFRRTRDGDRFYFKMSGIFTSEKLKEIDKSSLSRIYCDNLKNLVSIQSNAFKAPMTYRNPQISCERIPGINLCLWKELKYFTRPCLHGGLSVPRGKECCCQCKGPWGGSRCEQCKKPYCLGMQDGKILDSQITASSQYDANHGPTNARLNFRPTGWKTGAWSARYAYNQWLQVDFKRQATVTEIQTQGRNGRYQWVKSYTVSYSNDGIHFKFYLCYGWLKIFPGNKDCNTIVKNSVYPAIVARYIRIHPKTWFRHISMRVEFRGCLEELSCASKPCVNGGTCIDYHGTYECRCTAGYGGKNCEVNVGCLTKA